MNKVWYLPQAISSLPSAQSDTKLQTLALGTWAPLLHVNTTIVIKEGSIGIRTMTIIYILVV